MKKGIKIAIAGVTALVLAGGLATTLVLNFKISKDINKLENLTSQLSKKLDKASFENDSEDDFEEEDWDDEWYDDEIHGDVQYEDGDYYHENGELIVIGDEYKIRDFDYIAQAYLKNDESLLKSGADKETYQYAKEVIEELIKPEMTEYEKELAIHDWLCENITFDSGSIMSIGSALAFSDTPYGAFKYKMAVCVGYATTFRLLTTMAGLECDIIHDWDYSHTWNIIKIEGEYYIVDVYSDDVDDDTIIHTYFNITEDQMDYSWDLERYPRAEGTEFSYAAVNSIKLETADEIYNKLVEISGKGGELYFRMEGNLSVADVVYILNGYTDRINSLYDAYADYRVSDYDAENPVYSVTVEVYGDEIGGGEVDLEDMTMDKYLIDEKLDELFGNMEYDY